MIENRNQVQEEEIKVVKQEPSMEEKLESKISQQNNQIKKKFDFVNDSKIEKTVENKIDVKNHYQKNHPQIDDRENLKTKTKKEQKTNEQIITHKQENKK